MFKNYKIKLLDITLFFLSISLSLWSTTWIFLDLIKSSYLLYISIFFTSVIVLFTKFNFRKIENEVFFFLVFFLLINFTYYLLAVSEYFVKNQNTTIVHEYFVKQSILVIFVFLFYKYIFNEKKIDKFIKYLIISYVVIFLVLIYFYLYVFKADYIGVKIDFAIGNTRVNKNTLALCIGLLLPFFTTYIIKKKKYFIGLIFAILYFFIIIKIDSTTSLILLCFQLFLYFFIYYKKKILIFLFSILFILSALLLFDQTENDLYYQDLILIKEVQDIDNYLNFKSHRGYLLKSSLQKIKSDFYLGSGTETFRIRDENNESFTETHNTFLNIAVSYGIIGFFLYFYFYYFLFKKIYKKNIFEISNYDSACLIYILSLMVVFNSVNFEYTPIVWLLNCICLCRAYNK